MYKFSFLSLIVCCSQTVKVKHKQTPLAESKSNFLIERILPPSNFKQLLNDSIMLKFYFNKKAKYTIGSRQKK